MLGDDYCTCQKCPYCPKTMTAQEMLPPIAKTLVHYTIKHFLSGQLRWIAWLAYIHKWAHAFTWSVILTQWILVYFNNNMLSLPQNVNQPVFHLRRGNAWNCSLFHGDNRHLRMRCPTTDIGFRTCYFNLSHLNTVTSNVIIKENRTLQSNNIHNRSRSFHKLPG